MIEIVAAGPGTTVQDEGRPGLTRWGIGPSGAADRSSFRLANRLVGNLPGSAAIEVTLGGLTLVASRPVLVAVTGAVTPLRSAAPRVGFGIPFVLPADSPLSIDRPGRRLRTYVAVHGGVVPTPVFGSRSTDTLGGLGPQPLRVGTVLPIGPAVPDAIRPIDATGWSRPDGEVVVRVMLGPRDDWTEASLLDGADFVVRPDSDRIGVRLDGPALPRRPGELAPEAMIRGAVQLPPDGRPIVLGPDHPVTGGYPVVAVVVDADLDAVAQCRPGDRVRFRIVGGVPSRW